MDQRKGFSLMELLIVIAIILIIAAIAIPNLLRARIASNEASAVTSVRTISSAMILYEISYPQVGYAGSLAVLGSSPCPPTSTGACLIDGSLAAGAKSGYKFGATGSGGPPARKYYVTATPSSFNVTGVRSFCSYEDAVIRSDSTGTLPGSQSACEALSPLGSPGAGSSAGSGSGGGSSGGSSGDSSEGNGGGNGGGNGNSNGNSGGNGNGNGNGNSGGNGTGNSGGNGKGNGNGRGDGGGGF